MPAALLDTNAVSDLMRDHPQVKARIGKYADPIVTSVVVVGEIRYGLDRLPAGKKRTDLEARAQSILAPVRIEPVTEQIANAYHYSATLSISDCMSRTCIDRTSVHRRSKSCGHLTLHPA